MSLQLGHWLRARFMAFAGNDEIHGEAGAALLLELDGRVAGIEIGHRDEVDAGAAQDVEKSALRNCIDHQLRGPGDVEVLVMDLDAEFPGDVACGRHEGRFAGAN